MNRLISMVLVVMGRCQPTPRKVSTKESVQIAFKDLHDKYVQVKTNWAEASLLLQELAHQKK